MNTNKAKAFDIFLDEKTDEANANQPKHVKNAKKAILADKEGLIERVDKILVTKDGKQLLREQY